MSLIRPIVRMCAVAALSGATWAEDRVYDSDNTPLAEALANETKPYIVVYTDEDSRTDIEGRSVYDSVRSLSLVVEFGLANAIDTEKNGMQIEIPATDDAMEFAVDVIESQIISCLFGEQHSQWTEMLKDMIIRVTRVPSQRGGSAEKGMRWAARQLVFMCDVISDPPPGVPLASTHVIPRFIAAAAQVSDLATEAQLLAAVLDYDKVPDWRQAQGWLGLTTEGIRALGVAPVLEGDETAATIEDITDIDMIFLDADDLTVGGIEIS